MRKIHPSDPGDDGKDVHSSQRIIENLVFWHRVSLEPDKKNPLNERVELSMNQLKRAINPLS